MARFMGGRAWCSGLSGALLMLFGCGAKYPRQPDDKAALVGMHEARDADNLNSWVRGTIRRLDGRAVKLIKEQHLEPGCHTLEVQVVYQIYRPDASPCVVSPCDRITRYWSGRRHFAIPMRPGRRYELSAHIREGGAWAYFVEVDPALGTVARFVPVVPGTTTCKPGIAL